MTRIRPDRNGALEAQGIGMVFRSGFAGRSAKVALREVSLAIGGDRPTITAVVGESGSGKTTLTRILLGFQRPTGGRVTYRGVDLTGLNRAQRLAFRREVQAVFQDPFEAFNPFYVIDHALFTPLARFGLTTSAQDARDRVEAALATVGLRPSETLGRYPHQLSGGQRQRVMIARALLLDPSIILADEPVSMVDASLRSSILQTLLQVKEEIGISLIYVTHDLTTAYQIADTVVVLYAGSIVETGRAETVILAPKHPYTQALVDAIPSPDPDVSWGLDKLETPVRPAEPAAPGGCPFAARCPHRQPACDAAIPELRATDPDRRVRCILYPALPAGVPLPIGDAA